VNAVAVQLLQPPTVEDMLSQGRESEQSTNALASSAPRSMPVVRADRIVTAVAPAIVNAYCAGARFARLPAGHDDDVAWARSLAGYAAEFASRCVQQFTHELVRQYQEGNVNAEETS
jgi:hypothetical protein